ncbi:hypothetical protein [Neolewinella litorea]|uniref:Adhesin domain-containing protein n=1 Tax=Neolewinella litorea TaxID=2562452 RepID=A0A4S4NKM5_9BACT|nr:hypothetical protein [Neolewinella litorea]THH39367.1 hypothetical protein E4021_11475 [Neolewinella litorea]
MTTLYHILFFLCLTASLTAQQNFKIAVAGKAIEFSEMGEMTLIGTSGNELVIEHEGTSGEDDRRAAGLRKISALGLRDNTGLGLSVTESEGRILIQPVGSSDKAFTVRVPNSARVTVEQSTERGGGLTVENFAGPLDVSMMYHEVQLKNATGPLAVNTIYDVVTATWDSPPTQEARLHSTYAGVDVTLPAVTRATLRLSTGYGDMFTDFDLQIKSNTLAANGSGERDREEPDAVKPGTLVGTIGGGGTLLALTSTYSNLYLRKK